jgi:acetyl-CoA carboxylase biotin carboxylase subunit
MRVVHTEAALLNAINVTKPRRSRVRQRPGLHGEVPREARATSRFQVLADNYGNVIHLGERDCSMQRRHQKVVEEAPAPGITRAAPREKMGERCVEACRAVGYRRRRHARVPLPGRRVLLHRDEHAHPGRAPGDRDGHRHRPRQGAAADRRGREAAVRRGHRVLRGHAIECRINAEDPKTFMPSPGPVKLAPAGRPRHPRRQHIYSGYNVPPNYDSMIGKLIAHGDTRDTAIARMKNALAEMVVEGIRTNTRCTRR